MSEDQIKKLAEDIYEAWWAYNGCTGRNDMIPWLEKVIQQSIDKK